MALITQAFIKCVGKKRYIDIITLYVCIVHYRIYLSYPSYKDILRK